jgi:hypothetical protein
VTHEITMTIDTNSLKNLVEHELDRITDARVTSQICGLLVELIPVPRDWNYGVKGQQYVCWNVLEHHPSNTAIAYCQSGFGPRTPWGLVALEGPHMAMGVDSGWFPSLMEAYFESFVPTVLPIWRVFKTDPSGLRGPITPEGGWDKTWKHVMRYTEEDSISRYDCDCDASISLRE